MDTEKKDPGSKDPEDLDLQDPEDPDLKVTHYGFCGTNLRSAQIMGAICLVYSTLYLMLWIIEMSQVPISIVNILAVVFYVLSLNAYILLIVATVKTMKKAKIFLIIFITMAIISAILGVAALVINIRDEFEIGDALDQGNNILVWICSIGLCVWSTVVAVGAIKEVDLRIEEDPHTEEIDPENPDPKDPDPKDPDPKDPDPKDPDPKNPDPKDPDPKNPDPKNPDPKNPDPKNPDSKNLKTKDSKPKDPKSLSFYV